MLAAPLSLENDTLKVILESKIREDKVQVMNPSTSLTFTRDVPPESLISQIPLLKDAYMLTIYQIIIPQDLVVDFILAIWNQENLTKQVKSICAFPQLPDRVFIECESVEIFLPYLRHFVYELVQPYVFLSNFVNIPLYKHAQKHDLCRIMAFPYTNEPAQIIDISFTEKKALLRCWPKLVGPQFNATQRRSYPFDIETIDDSSSAFEEIPIVLKFDGSEYNPNGFIFRGNKYLDEFIILKIGLNNLLFNCEFSQYEIDRFADEIESIPVEKTQEEISSDDALFLNFVNSIRRLCGQSVSESTNDYIRTKLRTRESYSISHKIHQRSSERHGIVGRAKLRSESKSKTTDKKPELENESEYSSSEDTDDHHRKSHRHSHKKRSRSSDHHRHHSHSHSHRSRSDDEDDDSSSRHRRRRSEGKKSSHRSHHRKASDHRKHKKRSHRDSSSDDSSTDNDFAKSPKKKIGRPSKDDIAERRRQEQALKKKEKEYAKANIKVEPKKKISKRVIKPKKPPQVKDLWFPTPGHPQPPFTDPNSTKVSKSEKESKPQKQTKPKSKLVESDGSGNEDAHENIPSGLISNFPEHTNIIGVAVPDSENPVFRAGKPVTEVPLIVEAREDDPPFLSHTGIIKEFSQGPIDRSAIDGDLVQIDGGDIGVIHGSKLLNLANEESTVNPFHAMPLQCDNTVRDNDGNRILPGDHVIMDKKDCVVEYTIKHRAYISQKEKGIFVPGEELSTA